MEGAEGHTFRDLLKIGRVPDFRSGNARCGLGKPGSGNSGNQPVAGALRSTEERRVQGAAAGRCVDHTKGRRPQMTFRGVREAMVLVLSLMFLVHYLMSNSSLGIPPIWRNCLMPYFKHVGWHTSQ